MDHRNFNGVMPSLNEDWTAKVLGMKRNLNPGPDLISKDEKTIVEVKFTIVGNGCEKYPIAWTVRDEQLRYADGKTGFWGLATYELDRSVREIRKRDVKHLERIVLDRTIWIVPWEWMNQFPPHQTSGESKTGSWNNIFRYPKQRYLPKGTERYSVARGTVILTKGVDKKYFPNLS